MTLRRFLAVALAFWIPFSVMSWIVNELDEQYFYDRSLSQTLSERLDDARIDNMVFIYKSNPTLSFRVVITSYPHAVVCSKDEFAEYHRTLKRELQRQ